MQNTNRLNYKYQFTVWLMVLLSLFLMRARGHHKTADAPEKITIAYSATPDAALAQIAQVQGYYLQEGLEAVPQKYPYGKVALQALLEGKSDFATVAETPVMLAIVKGEKIIIIATIETANKHAAIVARKDKGILTPGDLKDKKIAVTSGTSGDFFMDAFLITHGISKKNITVADLKPEKLPEALANGDVDAVSAFNPFLNQAQKKLGKRGTTFYDEDIYMQTFNVVAKQEFVLKNQDKVKKILRALIKAEEFVKQNPDEAQKIAAGFSRIDQGLVRDIWANTRFSVALDQSLVLALEDESRWAIRSGLTDKTKVPNYLDFIYFDGLESVKPQAVRILR